MSNKTATQGRMLGPCISTLYMTDCKARDVMYLRIKFDNDAALVSLIHNDNEKKYNQLQSFLYYCNGNFKKLSVTKNEMENDFRCLAAIPPPVLIQGIKVDKVSSY